MSDVNPGLAYRPLEVRDFSGGMTDFYLAGDPFRYERADNFLISTDKQLHVRPGSVPFDSSGNHILPAANVRVDKLFTFKNETKLLAQQGSHVYYLGTAWTELTGPTGNNAFNTADSYEHLSLAQTPSHLYFTHIGTGRPCKVFIDSTGAWRLRTVGLPPPSFTPRYSTNTLLAKCIEVANAIRTSMIAHMNDYASGSSEDTGYLHLALDSTAAAYVATAATDEASMYALVQGIANVLNTHALDPLDSRDYHYAIYYNDSSIGPKGPFEYPSSTDLPTTLADAADLLDEFFDLWDWHRLSIYTHSRSNDYGAINKHSINATKIGSTDTTGTPSFTGNYALVLEYAKNLKTVYNQHVTNGYSVDHFSSETSDLPQSINFPDPTTLEEAKILIYWIWTLYAAIHVYDSNLAAHTNFNCDGTAGSTTYTTTAIGGGNITLPVGTYVVGTYAQFGTGAYSAKVIASSSGSATLDKAATTSDSKVCQYSASVYHGSLTAVALATTTTTKATEAEFLTTYPTSAYQYNILPLTTQAWVDLAAEVFTVISAHVENADTHKNSSSISNLLGSPYRLTKPTVSSYVYAFTYYDYYVADDGKTYAIESPVTYSNAVETDTIYPLQHQFEADFTGCYGKRITDISEVTLSTLPVLVNSSADNYNTAALSLRIYRTQNAGSTYYLLGSVTNGTTSYTDYTADELDGPGYERLSTQQTLYITGGNYEYTQPPECRFLHIHNNIAYYAHIIEGDQELPNRIRLSIPSVLEASPQTFYIDMDDTVKGITSYRGQVIALCEHNIFRLSGFFSALGNGSVSAVSISPTIGCISNASIVQTDLGIFFASQHGFAYTDGFQAFNVSIDIPHTYADLIKTDEQKARIHGEFDVKNRTVWWAVQSQDGSKDCDQCFCLNVAFGVKPSGAFTKIHNTTHFKPSALCFFENDLIRGDSRGLIFRHNEKYLSDPYVPSDVTTTLTSWQTAYIPFDYTSCSIDFGSFATGKWISKIHLIGKNAGNCNLQINSIADNRHASGEGKRALAPVRYTDNELWGDASISWDSATVIWKNDGKLDVIRRFPYGTLRSQTSQVQIEPARVGVYRYDDYPVFSYANVNATTKVVTIAQPTGFSGIVWPGDAVGMYISFSYDNYVNEFLITAIDGDELTFSDAGNTIAANLTNQVWVIRGYMKEAGFKMIGYVLSYSELGERGRTYPGKTGRGENA